MFDAACLFDVLEHVVDDVGLLDNVHTLLKPGGVLLLTTMRGAELPPEHFRHYEVQAVRNLLDVAGFRVRSVHVEEDKYPYVVADRA
jgi:2-polyprenyl-3-methyl-5-hydroxy-6-metoxy-1,4-benzoquinol methylase